jgi:Fur family transcriptional regulator, ferric uptake regulator
VTNDAAHLLRAGNHRMGRARRLVVEALGHASGPVTAEHLIAALPDVHPSSVYRALVVLEELGLVRHVHLAHGAALYELSERISSVRHLVCEVCGRTVQVPADLFEAVARVMAEDHGFILDSDHFAVPGRCTTCERR